MNPNYPRSYYVVQNWFFKLKHNNATNNSQLFVFNTVPGKITGLCAIYLTVDQKNNIFGGFEEDERLAS